MSTANTFSKDYARFCRLAEVIARDEIKVVSFDIYDTLVSRLFLRPVDVFEQLQTNPKVVEVFGPLKFASQREQAERIVRLEDRFSAMDPTLDDIYEQLSALSGIDRTALAPVLELESELEVSCVRPRSFSHALYEFARKSGKRVIFCSDMYLPRSVIERVLSTCGYELENNLYLSCEIGGTKKHGTIFPIVEKHEGIAPNEVLHLGDNPRSDIRQATQAGWRALEIREGAAGLLNIPGNGLETLVRTRRPSQILDPAARSTLGLITHKLYDKHMYWSTEDLQGRDFKTLGYIALGPFVLSLALWIRRMAKRDGIETMHMLARDGYLPRAALELLEASNATGVNVKYLPISRQMLQPYYLAQPGGVETVLGVGRGDDLLTREFVERRFGALGLSVIQDALGAQADLILAQNLKDSYETVTSILRKHAPALRAQNMAASDRLVAFYRKQIPADKRAAIFDVGRKGSFQAVLKEITGQPLQGYYVVNSYQMPRLLTSGSYDVFLGTIDRAQPGAPRDTIVYEALLSDRGGSFNGIDANGTILRDAPETASQDEDAQPDPILQVQEGALNFVRSAIDAFGPDLSMLEQNPSNASWMLEHGATDPVFTDMFNQLTHEDKLSTNAKRSLAQVAAGKRTQIKDELHLPERTRARRVVVFCPAVTRLRGGAERIAVRITNHLISQGYEVMMCSQASRPGPAVYDLEPGVLLRTYPGNKPEIFGEMMQAYQPDIALVLASGPVILPVCQELATAKVPYILSERADPAMSYEAYWGDWTKSDYHAVYDLADQPAVQLSPFRDFFPEEMQSRVAVLPNPIELPKPTWKQRKKTIVACSRLALRQKRPDLLLRAFEKVAADFPDWTLAFYGDDSHDARAQLKAYAEEKELEARVTFSDSIPDISPILETAGIFAMTSAFEGFPNSLAEALAHGAPAIGFSECPGLNVLIQDGRNGRLIEADSEAYARDAKVTLNELLADERDDIRVEAMALGLADMMSNESKRRAMSKGAREVMRDYDAPRVLAQWEDAITNVLAQPRYAGSISRPALLSAVTARRESPLFQWGAFSASATKTLESIRFGFTKAHENSTLLMGNWHAPDTTGVWSSDTCATVLIPLPAGAGARQLKVRLRALGGTPKTPLITLAVKAGSAVHKIERSVRGGDPFTVVLPLPDMTQNQNSFARVELQTTIVARPCDVRPSNTDQRRLGVMLQEIAVVPITENDLPEVIETEPPTFQLSFDRKAAGKWSCIGGSWHPPEPTGCWTNGPEGTFALPIRATASGSGSKITIRGRVLGSTQPSGKALSFDLQMNDVYRSYTFEAEDDGSSDYILDLPELSQGGISMAYITVRRNIAPSPKDLDNLRTDERPLGFLMQQACVEPL